MSQRIDYRAVARGAYQAMVGVETYLRQSGLEPNLMHLAKLRASQLNRCGYCIDMHWKDLRAGGESEPRLYLLDAWVESSLYSKRERAAFEWTEALTLLQTRCVTEAAYHRARAHFTEKELADLTFLIAAINAWNRLAIAAGDLTESHDQSAARQTRV